MAAESTLGETGTMSHGASAFPESLKGKRILLCTESFGPVNGVSRTTLMLVNHLRSHGAIVAVVAPRNHTQQDTFLPARQEGDAQIEVRIGGYPVPFNPELSIVYPVRLTTLIAKTFGEGKQPDLIYLASPASLGFQVLLQARQQPAAKEIPVVCNFQTDLGGYCAILFPRPLSDLAVHTFAAVEGYLFRHSSVKAILYPSRFVRRYLEKQRVQEEKMYLLGRGVNTDLFNPARRNDVLRKELAPNGEIILICVCRVAGEKGFDFLARAAKLLDARGLRFTLYIVGGNRNAEVERGIQGMFDPLREKRRVVFAGFRVGEELAAAYASADVFLHCSVTETFGLVVLESMASGVPVVARDEGGPSDIVRHGRSGYLVAPHDLEGFVQKVMVIAADRSLRERLGVEARMQACEATWEKINNRVAWKMAEVVQERSALEGLAERPAGFWSSAVVGARIVGALGVISVFWVLTKAYSVFTETVMRVRSLSGMVLGGGRR